MSKCRNYILFTVHNFDRWKIVEKGNIRKSEDNGIVGIFIIQERRCKDCGYTEKNVVKNSLI